MKICDVQKVNSAILPTPIHVMKNLTNKVGKAKLLIKRDDLTGIGFGGNKLRKLEYIVKDALDNGYTTLLTYGDPQTNHGRLTAAIAAKFGLKCVIMCYGTPPKKATGNILLDKILGAEICFMDTTDVLKLSKEELKEGFNKLTDDSTKSIIEKYEEKGEKVYVIPMGGRSALGTLGYIKSVEEIMKQLKEMNEEVDYLVVGLGTGGTYAGLWLGAKYYNAPFKVIGLTVSNKQKKDIEVIVEHMNEVSEKFELGIDVKLEDIKYENSYFGEGYNIPDKKTREYMYLLAQNEGIFVDPCYTAKTFRGYMELVENEIIPRDKTAMFIHTGGKPGIFSEEHLESMQDELWNDEITIFQFKGL